MISRRLAALSGGNSAIRAMFEEGRRLAALYGRENVYDFSLGNPNFPAPGAVAEQMTKILREEDSLYVHGYMPNAGYPEVRRAVAEDLTRRCGVEYGENSVLMTVGAAGGLNCILQTLLDPGDEVLVFAPYFLEYGNYVANFGGVLRQIPPNPPTFQPSAGALAAAITEKTKALILNNPNNPTGVVYTEESLRAVAAVLEAAEERFGHPIYILSDEPYRDLVYDGKVLPSLPAIYRDTLTVFSWSKSLSLPGERIGYLAIPKRAEDAEAIFAAAAISNRILGFVNAPSLQQLAVARCLSEKTNLSGYDENRKALYRGLTGLGFSCVYPEGAFYLFLKTPGDDKEFVRRAKEHRILVVPGSSFACPGYVRIAYCVSPEQIGRSMPAFAALAAELGLSPSEK